ncbi:MAG: metallophosphoesterase [Chloroflexi bacterium]|nr:metallophosphoesterase [Chloroflexota bacterium]
MNLKKDRVRLLHTSDLHLVNTSPDREDRACLALKAVVELSIQAEVDLVIIAGDLFDHNRIEGRTLEFVSRELGRVPVPMLILPGNHDCLVPDSVYRRASFPHLAPNVRVFTASQGETFSFPELDLAVWGKPLYDYGSDLRPMAGIPPRGSERWQIAVAHGYYVGSRSDPTHSFQIHDEDIAESGRDYVALGHWGDFYCVSAGPVKTYYSGPSTVSLVDFLDGHGVQVRPHHLPL